MLIPYSILQERPSFQWRALSDHSELLWMDLCTSCQCLLGIARTQDASVGSLSPRGPQRYHSVHLHGSTPRTCVESLEGFRHRRKLPGWLLGWSTRLLWVVKACAPLIPRTGSLQSQQCPRAAKDDRNSMSQGIVQHNNSDYGDLAVRTLLTVRDSPEA